MRITTRQSWWAAVALLLLLAGCSQDTPQPYPSVTAVSPEAAAAGTNVTLTGENFSPDPAKNVVTFSSYEGNSVMGTVERATSTELVVRVPLTAFAAWPSAVISVTTEGRSSSTVVLKSDFYPEVFSVRPQPARAGEVVTITGKNFNLDSKQTRLLFLPPENEPIPQGYKVPRVFPMAATDTTLQVQVPADAKSGEIWVTHYLKPDGSTYISQTLPITIAP